jgi:hypothetical protein
MIRSLIFSLIFLTLSAGTFAQEMPELEYQFKLLKSQNELLLKRVLETDRKYYEEERKKLDIAATLGVKLSERWRGIQNNITILNGMNRINQINSIGEGNALGLNFSETMQQLARQHLVVSFPKNSLIPADLKQKTESRWKGIVDRVLNNDIMKAVVQSNPFTAIANSLIHSAVNFSIFDVKTRADIKLEPVGELPKKYTDFRDEWTKKYRITAKNIESITHPESAISDESIKAYSSAISHYIMLYDEMAKSDLRYSIQIREVENMHGDYSELIANYDEELKKSLNISNLSQLPSRINELTYVNEQDWMPDYRGIMERKELTKARNLANQYNSLREKVNELTVKYYEVNINYFREYIAHLNTALEMTDKGHTRFDRKKILDSRAFLQAQVTLCERYRNNLLPLE